MKYRVSAFLMVALLGGCYSEADFSPASLNHIMELRIHNDYALADNVSEVEVQVRFPKDFSTEDDGMVAYTLFRNPQKALSSELQYVQEAGVNVIQSTLGVTHQEPGELHIRAQISVNDAIISRDTVLSFVQAFPERIIQTVSTPQVIANSFDPIAITTTLERDTGMVSRNTRISLQVVDTIGMPRGRLDGLVTRTDITGKVQNSFAMGSDPYIGELYLIAEADAGNGTMLRDTLLLIVKE